MVIKCEISLTARIPEGLNFGNYSNLDCSLSAAPSHFEASIKWKYSLLGLQNIRIRGLSRHSFYCLITSGVLCMAVLYVV